MGITVVPYSPRGTDGFMMITVTPPATAVRVTPRDVTVVIDVSGSMSGHKIEQARAAARDVLATLRPTDRFRLIDFSTDVRAFRDAYVEATPEMIAQARRYIDSLDADGGTNIDGALAEALRPDVVPGRLPLVLFVTDGEPTVGVSDPTSIMEHVARWRGTRRIFTFGLGEDVNASLLEQLALDGRGTYRRRIVRV
jgi:Ca-activated chloride channel family protein